MLFPYSSADGTSPGCSEPEPQSGCPWATPHPSLSTPEPLLTSQVLVWNLASASRGEESHQLLLLCKASDGSSRAPLRRQAPSPAHDSPVRQCHRSHQIPCGGTGKHQGKLSIPFWHWTSRAKRLPSHSYFLWRFSFSSIISKLQLRILLQSRARY